MFLHMIYYSRNPEQAYVRNLGFNDSRCCTIQGKSQPSDSQIGQ